ncbi:hypothetical protein Droror1_Dr00019408 [Drosera rotundifolia]
MSTFSNNSRTTSNEDLNHQESHQEWSSFHQLPKIRIVLPEYFIPPRVGVDGVVGGGGSCDGRDGNGDEDGGEAGKKVRKKLQELKESSSMGWKRATELHEEEVRYSIKKSKLEIIQEKMMFEKDMIIAETKFYEIDGSMFEKDTFIARKSRLAKLQAEYDDFIEDELNSSASNSINMVLNQSGASTSSFNPDLNDVLLP